MPGEAARNWFVHVGKMLGPTETETSIDYIATSLGFKKTSMLNSCIRDTATSTTRQIIKAIHKPSELSNKRGKDVTVRQRKLIRGSFSIIFVQFHGRSVGIHICHV
mgnify:CR=1 FL=1